MIIKKRVQILKTKENKLRSTPEKSLRQSEKGRTIAKTESPASSW
jgi:hypothetical protein